MEEEAMIAAVRGTAIGPLRGRRDKEYGKRGVLGAWDGKVERVASDRAERLRYTDEQPFYDYRGTPLWACKDVQNIRV